MISTGLGRLGKLCNELPGHIAVVQEAPQFLYVNGNTDCCLTLGGFIFRIQSDTLQPPGDGILGLRHIYGFNGDALQGIRAGG